MQTIEILHVLTLAVSALVAVGILSSLIAARFGAPLLLVFLVVGMLVGEDGPGGIAFDDYRLAYLIGSVGLAVILFDGGLRTRLASFRQVILPASLLATLGVAITALIVGLAAILFLGLTTLQGLLVGAMVASTDAAAVFFLLRTGGLQIRSRVRSLLEIESGTNDPVAIFLTIVLAELILAGNSGEAAGLMVLGKLLQQAALGAAGGILGGYGLTVALNRLDLPGGLHPLFVITSAIALFSFTEVAGGSGYLAAYVAGLVVGNRPIRAAASVISFHDTATWLCQIAMFIVLGLLVTPSQMLPSLWGALGVAIVLMVIARPLAVFVCLAPFSFSWKEQGFVAWVGLRGAVSIFLAAIPTLAALPNAEIYFNVAFVVVLVSLLVQGWTISPLSRYLGVALSRISRPVHRVEIDLPGQLTHEMVGYPVTKTSPVLSDVSVPIWARPVFVVRDDKIIEPGRAGALVANDYAYFLAPPDRVPMLDRLFAADSSGSQPAAVLLPIRASAPLGVLADLYGAEVDPENRNTTVADWFDARLEKQVAIGDRIELGPVMLAARLVENDRVTEAAIIISEPDRAIASLGEATMPLAGWRAWRLGPIAGRIRSRKPEAPKVTGG